MIRFGEEFRSLPIEAVKIGPKLMQTFLLISTSVVFFLILALLHFMFIFTFGISQSAEGFQQHVEHEQAKLTHTPVATVVTGYVGRQTLGFSTEYNYFDFKPFIEEKSRLYSVCLQDLVHIHIQWIKL